MYRAMIEKDADALNDVLDDSFVLQHMTGMKQNKRAFIKAVMDGTLNYYSCRDDSIDVKINGEKAALIGRSQVKVAIFGGGRHSWRLEQAVALRLTGGAWRITGSVARTY